MSGGIGDSWKRHRPDDLPPYSIRESKKARRVSLRVRPEQGLEVVIPVGFDLGRIPRVVAEHRDWIADKLRRCSEDLRHDLEVQAFPDQVFFKAIERTVRIEYAHENESMLHLEPLTEVLVAVRGDLSERGGVFFLLKEWLRHQARIVLIPWLERLSHETGLRYGRVQIRAQKSRWGSCSSRGTLSLNERLLFVDPEVVRYILIHELCHLAHPNHSKGFWHHVEMWVPRYKELDQHVRKAFREIPRWVI